MGAEAVHSVAKASSPALMAGWVGKQSRVFCSRKSLANGPWFGFFEPLIRPTENVGICWNQREQ